MADTDAGGAIATAVLIVGTGAGNMAAFCPSWFTVRSPFFHDQSAREGNVKAIRQGEIAATALTVAEGWAASMLTGSALPLIGAVIVCGVMVAGYEYSMRHPSQEVAQGREDAGRPVHQWTRRDAAPQRGL